MVKNASGLPVNAGILRLPQTDSLSMPHRRFSPAEMGGLLGGLTPSRVASILHRAEQGDIISQATLFDIIEEQDAHIFAELSKRKRALLTVPWDIAPPRNGDARGQKVADALRETLLDLPDLEDMILDLADAIGKGFACLEIAWRQEGGQWLPGRIHHRPQRWFTVNPDQPDEIRLRDDSSIGQALQPFGWLVHVHKARSGYPGAAGLFRVLAWPFIFKVYGIADLAELLETYGIPHRIGVYPAAATEAQRRELLRAVTNMGHSASGVIPEGMRIEYQQALATNADPFRAMIDWAEKSASKAILGGTLTSQADGQSSTNALGNVHDEVRRDILISDARQIAGTVTRDLLLPLAVLNHGVADMRQCPRFAFDTSETADLNQTADALGKLAGLLAIPASWARERTGIPEPADGEEVLQKPAPPAPAAPPMPAASAPPAEEVAPGEAAAKAMQGHAACPHCAALTASGDLARDTVDEMTERLRRQAGAIVQRDMIDPVVAMLESVTTLEEARDRLDRMFPSMDPAALSQLLAEAMMAAELAGRYEATHG